MRPIRLVSVVILALLLNACGFDVRTQDRGQQSANSPAANAGDLQATVEAQVRATMEAQLAQASPAAAATPTASPSPAPSVEASATEAVPTSTPEADTTVATDPCPSPATADAAPVAATQEPAAPPAMLLILDASGSMLNDDGTGRLKIDAAKEALNALVDALPDGAPVGLRVYGHRVPNTDKANGCQDTELIAPLAPLNKSEMKSRIASFEAKGWTPIATSLEQAANDLPPEGERTIVLVSDGEETCDRDPCQAARDLLAKGIQVKVETVGFQVDATTRRQLECIAEATGGEYRDVSNAAELADTLKQISTRALKTYQTVGSAVQGGDSFNNAAALRPGQYQDSIKVNQTLYYAVELQEGQRLRFSATLVGQPDVKLADEPGAQVVARLYGPARQNLGSTSEYGFGRETKTVVFETDPLPETGRYFISVTADQYTDFMQGREFKTELVVEVVGEDAGDPCAGEGASAVPTPVPPGPVQGGDSFNNPTVLQAGQYQDTIKVNETLYYAFALEEGQRLRFSATLIGQPDVNLTDEPGATIKATLYGPERQNLGSASEYGFGRATKTAVLETEPIPQTGLYYAVLAAEQYTKFMDGREFQTELIVEVR